MGWLTKILKGYGSGSNHRVTEGRYDERYENDGVWEDPRTTSGEVLDFDNEEIDRAIALSLAEEDERNASSVVEDDTKSVCSSLKEEEEDDQTDEVPSLSEEDQNDEVPSHPEEDRKGKKVIDDNSYLEEDEELAKAIQLSLNMGLPPRNNYGSLFPRLPNFFQGVYRTCAGCNGRIGHGRFLSCMGGVWHPECFRCHACNLPISDFEVKLYS